MTVVVTGAAGFIGARLASTLVADGVDVVGVDCFADALYPAGGRIERMRDLASHDRFSFVDADLRTAPLDELLHGATTVVHCAALPGLAPSWRMRDLYFEHNAVVTHRIVESVERAGGPFLVHLSTSSVYGERAAGDESMPIAPVSPYGESKALAEESVTASVEAGRSRAAILRLFSVYGPGQRPDMAYARVCEAILAGRPVTVFGDGSQRRSNTHVDDVVRAIRATMAAEPSGEILNIAGAESIALLDAIDLIATALGSTPEVEFFPAVAGDQFETRGDASRARALLGWRPLVAVADGLVEQAVAARSAGLTGALEAARRG